jgi:hypothetical protein
MAIERSHSLTKARRPRRAFALALFAVLAAPALRAQPAPPPGVRGMAGGMATRSVSRYLGLERQLLEASQRRDRTAMAAMLADDFELRSAAQADVLSADEWMQRERQAATSEALVRDLSVREIDDIAVVTFLLDRGTSARPAAATLFVVDVWRASTGKLLSRSMARARGAPPQPSRPTGRE